MAELETVQDYVRIVAGGKPLLIEERENGWGFWTNGTNMIGGRFKVKKPHQRIL